MNNIYTVENYEKLKKDTIRYLVFSILALLFGIAFVLLSGFFVNDKTITLVIIVDSLVLSISLCIFFYLIIFEFVNRKTRLKFTYQLLAVSRYEGEVTIIKINKPTIVKKGITAYEISVKDNNDKQALYYLEDFNKLDFKPEDKLKVVIASNFITEYEKENHDE